MSQETAQLEIGSFTASLAVLATKGIRYATTIDVGCADASFFLHHCIMGILSGSMPVNIDANGLYEPSLQAIRDVFGGYYFIAATSDIPGEATLTTSAHPYWSSVRPADDRYWQRVNQLSGAEVKVPAITLDQIAEAYHLKPPFLLKLDVQGAEVSTLRGAKKLLEQTSTVICEADLDDFHGINRILDDAGFDLFDITSIGRLPDHSVGWFYPVYLNRRLTNLRERSLWQAHENEQIIKAQADRRKELLAWEAEVLAKVRALKQGQQGS